MEAEAEGGREIVAENALSPFRCLCGCCHSHSHSMDCMVDSTV